jgi:hypothetical protein
MRSPQESPRFNVNSGPVRWLNGRPCQILPGRRIQQRNKAWGFFTTHEVRYLDDQQPPIEMWTAAKLNVALRRAITVDPEPTDA